MRSKLRPILIGIAVAAFLAVGTARAVPHITGVLAMLPAMSNDVLQSKIGAPFNVTPTRLTTLTASAATWAEFPATDIATGYWKDDVARNLVVTNIDSAAKICVDFVARNSVADCSVPCAALTTTCGSTTDGDIVLAGSSRSFRPAGTMCICFLSSAANGDVQLSEVVR